MGLPGGLAVENPPASAGDIRSDPRGREGPLEKEMATHRSILAWTVHGQKSLAGYSPWVEKELDTTYWLNNSNNSCIKVMSVIAEDYKRIMPVYLKL